MAEVVWLGQAFRGFGLTAGWGCRGRGWLEGRGRCRLRPAVAGLPAVGRWSRRCGGPRQRSVGVRQGELLAVTWSAPVASGVVPLAVTTMLVMVRMTAAMNTTGRVTG